MALLPDWAEGLWTVVTPDPFTRFRAEPKEKMRTVEIAGHALMGPIAVFDAGIGSYSAVAHIHDRFPDQDLVYLADRASFPYGMKTLPELRAIIDRTLGYLEALPVAAVVVASNVPSVTVLDDATAGRKLPVSRIVPPIRQALDTTAGDIVVLGVRALIFSTELASYIAGDASWETGRIHPRDASSLVELVENGAFLFARDKTQGAVAAYLDALTGELPNLTAMTLSSTHLPWLRDYFTRARPDLALLDPIDKVVRDIAPVTTHGTGTIVGLVTETPDYPAQQFSAMLERLNIDIPLTVVTLQA